MLFIEPLRHVIDRRINFPINLLPAVFFITFSLLLPGCTTTESPPPGTDLTLTCAPEQREHSFVSAQGEKRPALHFDNDRSFTTSPIKVPSNAVLETGFTFFHQPRKASLDNVLAWPSMTALFSVIAITANGETCLHHSRHSSSDLKEWHDLSLDLSSYSGSDVRFRFEWEEDSSGIGKSLNLIQPVWSIPNMFWRREGTKDEQRLVILISLDTLRADAIGCQGYHLSVSPLIDRFSLDTIQYTDCVSPSPWTRPAHMSILTSLYPHVHGLDKSDNRLNLSPSFKTWAEIFCQDGFWTMAVTGGGFVHSNNGFERGFKQYYSNREDFSRQCSRALDWLKSREHDDVFLFLHTFATHNPYNQFGRLIKHSAVVADRNKNNPPRKNEPLTRYEADRLRRLYDDGTLYADFCLGSFFRELKALGLYNKAMIILLSDHGELFFEHGAFGHSTLLYDQLLRVPLLIKYPLSCYNSSKLKPGLRVHRQVGLIDVLPTAAEVNGISSEGSLQFQGSSLLGGDQTLFDSDAYPYSRMLYAETYQGGTTWRGIRNDSLSYLVNETDNIEEIYDLSKDPEQMKNLALPDNREQLINGCSVSETLQRCRLFLGYANSMRYGGFHFSATTTGSKKISGKIEATSDLVDLTPFFPAEEGFVKLVDNGKAIRFRLQSSGSCGKKPMPRIFSFKLADPVAEISIIIDGRENDNSGSDISYGIAGYLKTSTINSNDPRLILPWNHHGLRESTSSIHFYRRLAVDDAESALESERQRQALLELGYILDD